MTPREQQPERCETCRFFVQSNRQYIDFECRRMPPIMVQHQSSCSAWRAPGWPEVSSDDWCGEYQKREG